MTSAELQALCETGQAQLMAMEYLDAERSLASAEDAAWEARDWDTLSRLYLPLQEARRQRRQRCGEGAVCLDLIAETPEEQIDARHVVENYPHGQLLVAGWGSVAPSIAVRALQRELKLYVDTFLAAAFPTSIGPVVVIVPSDDARLPSATPRSLEELMRLAPKGSVVLPADELPPGARKGSTQTFGEVMALWERLHAPFLAAADATPGSVARIEAYRTTITVDYACELAHQKLSDTARRLHRETLAAPTRPGPTLRI